MSREQQLAVLFCLSPFSYFFGIIFMTSIYENLKKVHYSIIIKKGKSKISEITQNDAKTTYQGRNVACAALLKRHRDLDRRDYWCQIMSFYDAFEKRSPALSRTFSYVGITLWYHPQTPPPQRLAEF